MRVCVTAILDAHECLSLYAWTACMQLAALSSSQWPREAAQRIGGCCSCIVLQVCVCASLLVPIGAGVVCTVLPVMLQANNSRVVFVRAVVQTWHQQQQQLGGSGQHAAAVWQQVSWNCVQLAQPGSACCKGSGFYHRHTVCACTLPAVLERYNQRQKRFCLGTGTWQLVLFPFG